MSVSDRDVRHIAALARVAVDDIRIPQLVSELNGILDHMDVLQQVELAAGDAESLVSAKGQSMPLRSDTLPADILHRSREEVAPLMRDGFFLVPRLATHDNLGSSAGNTSDDANGAHLA